MSSTIPDTFLQTYALARCLIIWIVTSFMTHDFTRSDMYQNWRYILRFETSTAPDLP